MSSYSVAHLDEIEEISDGREPWRPVRHHLGIKAFGINAWTAREAGDRIINEHDETDDGNEELYFVSQGRARFEIDGESVDAPSGTFVFVSPAAKRTAFAEEPATTLIAVGAVPGKAYEPGGWELWAPFAEAYQAGDHSAVADGLREIAEANPQYPALMYNLACCESLAGRTTEALAHLQQAVGGSERLLALAKEDSDLDAIRDDPAFKELVGG
jgi:mannose-6-phosphate isomerase-like protein (cupin superfamily)